MECDDVMLLLATSEQRTLTPIEETRVREHARGCDGCQTLASDARSEWRWLARVPADALDDRSLEVLPTVDPIVFEPSTETLVGGMGRITRTFDRRLGREVALKEILDDDLRRRFEREARITARLQHPAVVPIYEAGQFPDGASFYTMRFVHGRTLQHALDGASGLPERLALLPNLRAVADALAYAHARGVIHRDLKPSNVLVGEFGETVVIDWGLAKDLDGDEADNDVPGRPSSARLTMSGSVMGTPCFMSPAQAAGHDADETDDVYALGALLYQLLAGTPPYWDTTPHDAQALVDATLAGPPTSLDERAPDAPPDLRAIVARAMSRDKAQRYPTAKELADELARFEAGQLLLSRQYTVRELVARWLRRHRRAAVLGALVAIAVVVVAVMYVRYQRAAAELAIRAHGTQLTDLYGAVARQGYQIDRDLLKLESALEGLSAAAAWALAGPDPTNAPVFFDTQFADPETRPTDFTKQTAYRWEVSVEQPVVGVAPGVDRALHLPQIRRLVELRAHMRQMVLEAAVGDPTGMPATEVDAILRARKSPIDYAYVDLPAGIHVMWPGMASLRKNYDVRTSSFYLNSKDKRGKRWGAPYIDSTTDRDGDDLVLPCTKGIWSATGEFLGVAGVELTVTKLVETSMAMTTRTTLRTSLVDGQGKKVIDSRDANARFPAPDRDTAIEFVPFDLPDIAAEVSAGHEGVRETTRDGRPIAVAFTKLGAIGWYYVVEVDAATLGAK